MVQAATDDAKSKKAKYREATRCVTPEFRVSYPHLWKPYKNEDSDNDGPGKYSMALLFEETADLKALRRAAKAAKILKWGSDEAKWPKNLKDPFRDGEEKEAEGYGKGIIFVNATSKTKPTVIDQKKNRIKDETDERFYAGCYARASLQAYTFQVKGNKGVAFALHNIQKTRDGEAFSGRKRAEDEFEEIDDGSSESSDDDIDLED